MFSGSGGICHFNRKCAEFGFDQDLLKYAERNNLILRIDKVFNGLNLGEITDNLKKGEFFNMELNISNLFENFNISDDPNTLDMVATSHFIPKDCLQT